jgi:hypothetical protein
VSGSYAPLALSSTSADITFSGGDLSGPVTKSVSIGAKDKVTYAGSDKFTLKFASKSGLFTGSFVDKGVNRAFSGAVLQSGSLGMGLFQEPTGPGGSVLLQGIP